jgi:hypothetical protein
MALKLGHTKRQGRGCLDCHGRLQVSFVAQVNFKGSKQNIGIKIVQWLQFPTLSIAGYVNQAGHRLLSRPPISLNIV